jgi:uncharacterized protein (TIGR02391 family)
MARWDDIEILRAIDRIQQDRYGGGPIIASNGMYLMDEINGSRVVEDQRWRGFIQELHIAHDHGLLTFKVQPSPQPNLASTQPYSYLQTLSDFALTVKGQDRARGRILVQPPPDTAEDDGRQLSSLILKQIAASITEQYAPDEVAIFLREEGLPPAELPLPAGAAEGDALAILAGTWRSGSEGRRLLRRFVGRWLANLLPSGPGPELQVSLTEQLARQGWRIREADAALVTVDLARGVPGSPPFLRTSRLHPLIETEARPQFLIGKHEQGVFASMRAVEVRVRQLADLGNDAIGVDLMNKAFGPNGRLTDLSTPKGEQEGTRMLFAGAYAVLRNPAGHRQVNYDDVSEAADAVQTASLLMRILDRVNARPGTGARRSPPWTPDEVLESIASAGPDVTTVGTTVRDWAAAHPHVRVAGGTGISDRSFTMTADTGRSMSPLRAVLSLYATPYGTGPMLEIRIRQMCATPPYNRDEPRARLLADLRDLGIPRLTIPDALTRERPNIPLSELTNGRVDALLSVINRWIEQVRAHVGEPETAGDAGPQTSLR